MRKNSIIEGLVVMGLTLGGATASADDFRGFYAGAGIGAGIVDSGFVDDADTGFKLFAGYSFGEFLAVELSYIDGGKAEETDRGQPILLAPGLTLPGFTISDEVETEIVNLSVIGNLPLTESFALFGKLGYSSIELDGRFSFQLDNDTSLTAQSFRTRDEEISYGAGAVYSFGNGLQLRAEYEGFDVQDGRLEFISLSAVYKFR